MNIDLKGIEIHETKDGKIFAIKDLRQEIEKVGHEHHVTFKADIAGDIKAGRDYLEKLTFSLLKGFETNGTKVKIDPRDEGMDKVIENLEKGYKGD